MAKIGRNDPCPCGSGSKYKKCHGRERSVECRTIPKVREIPSEDPVSFRDAAMRYERKRCDIFRERQAVFSRPEACTLEEVENHERWIRAQLAQLIQCHSPLWWLCLQRTEKLASSRVVESQESYWLLVRSHLETLFWKYGDQFKNDVKFDDSGRIIARLRTEDECLYAGELAALAWESVNLPTVYRRLAKGATLEVGPDSHFIATLPPHLNAAGLKYDRRRNSERGYRLSEKGLAVPTTPYVGSWAAVFSCKELGLSGSSWPLLFYQENIEPEGTVEYSTGGFDGFEDPRFMRASWDLDQWKDRFECFSEALSAQTGMSLAEFKASILSLNDLLVSHLNGERGISCHELGLLSLPNAMLFDQLSSAISKHLPSTSQIQVEALIERFITFLQRDHAELDAYDLFSRPVPCVLNLERDDRVLIDVTQIHKKVERIMLELQFDAKMRTSKGATFEVIVGSEIRRRCHSISFPIPGSHHLFKDGADSPFAEADLYIAKCNLLFIVDCKAYCIDKRYLKGEPHVVRNRWRKIRGLLSESDERAKKIAANPVGSNYRIPAECKYIIPVVCSSMAEYIWEDEPMTQLTDSIPRVCTVGELIEILNDENLADLSQRPYAIQIAHPDQPKPSSSRNQSIVAAHRN